MFCSFTTQTEGELHFTPPRGGAALLLFSVKVQCLGKNSRAAEVQRDAVGRERRGVWSLPARALLRPRGRGADALPRRVTALAKRSDNTAFSRSERSARRESAKHEHFEEQALRNVGPQRQSCVEILLH